MEIRMTLIAISNNVSTESKLTKNCFNGFFITLILAIIP